MPNRSENEQEELDPRTNAPTVKGMMKRMRVARTLALNTQAKQRSFRNRQSMANGRGKAE